MRTKLLFLIFPFLPFLTSAQNVDDIVKKADEKMRGTSSQGEFTMIIQRPTWKREISMKNWTLGNEYSLVYITAPAKEKGQVFLKRQKEMWNWVPNIERMIKIPPSMMMQSWMGSDFTNNDLMKQNTLVTDYHHTIVESDTIEGYDCYVIHLEPLPEAAVVWGGINMWIAKEKFFGLKVEYLDDNKQVVKVETASNPKKMGDREILTHMEMIPKNKKGHSTIMDVINQEFDVPYIDQNFFSIQNIKNVRPR